MTSRLNQLLPGVPSGDFLRTYWGKTWLHSKPLAESCGNPVIPIAVFDRLLQSGAIPAGFVGVINRGVAIGAEKWSVFRTAATGGAQVAVQERLLEWYAAGATLILNRMDSSIAEVGDLCRQLASELKAGVHANAYITPPNAQGFPKHSDQHEVMVLQISGRKRWQLYPVSDPAAEVNTEAGDVLYIPRGMAHEAATSREPSVHLTLGLYPVYGYQLIEELARTASQAADFQAPVYMGPEGSELPWFAEELNRLAGSTGTGQLFGSLWRRFVDEQDAGWSGRLLDTLQLHALGPGSQVIRRREIVVLYRQLGSVLYVEFAGRRTSIAVFLRPALDRVMEYGPLVVRDLPGLMTDQQKIEFVRAFVASGLLKINQV